MIGTHRAVALTCLLATQPHQAKSVIQSDDEEDWSTGPNLIPWAGTFLALVRC